MSTAGPLTITAPNYATDGSRGYHLTTTLSTRMISGDIHGWIMHSPAGRVAIACLDGCAFRVIAPVEDLTAEWVDEHTDDILAAFVTDLAIHGRTDTTARYPA